jgi:hypothetical protein
VLASLIEKQVLHRQPEPADNALGAAAGEAFEEDAAIAAQRERKALPAIIVRRALRGPVLAAFANAGEVGEKRGEVHGQESGVRDQESGIRSQGSGVRSQGSGVRSQGSGVRDQEPGVRSQESGVRSQESEGAGYLA